MLLIAAATVACCFPARRVMKVEPMMALRRAVCVLEFVVRYSKQVSFDEELCRY
jgi:hypothetical protein